MKLQLLHPVVVEPPEQNSCVVIDITGPRPAGRRVAGESPCCGAASTLKPRCTADAAAPRHPQGSCPAGSGHTNCAPQSQKGVLVRRRPFAWWEDAIIALGLWM